MSRCIHLRALEPFAALPKGIRSLLSEIGGLLKTATPRQERLAARIPENPVPAAAVEKPPPPSDWWEQPSRRGKGKGKSRDSGWDRGNQWNSWDNDGWAGRGASEEGWSASWPSRGGKGKDSKGQRKGKGGDSWDSKGKGSWQWRTDEEWDEGNEWDASWKRPSKGKSTSKGEGKNGGKSRSSSSWVPVSNGTGAEKPDDAGVTAVTKSVLRADAANWEPGLQASAADNGFGASAEVWNGSWTGNGTDVWSPEVWASWTEQNDTWDHSWDKSQGAQHFPPGHDDTRLVPG